MTATASTNTMNDHITAETLEAILRAPTIEALEDAVQSLPIDVEAFHDRMQAIEATEPRPSPVEAREAIAEALQTTRTRCNDQRDTTPRPNAPRW